MLNCSRWRQAEIVVVVHRNNILYLLLGDLLVFALNRRPRNSASGVAPSCPSCCLALGHLKQATSVLSLGRLTPATSEKVAPELPSKPFRTGSTLCAGA